MSEFRNAVPVFFWRQIFSPPSGNCFEAFFRFLIFNILCPTLRKSRDDEDDVIGFYLLASECFSHQQQFLNFKCLLRKIGASK